MIAIKNWWLEKNDLNGLRGTELTIVKETEKAVLVTYIIDMRLYDKWVPKSVIINDWEKDTSNFGYHDYLESLCHKAYEDGKLFEKNTIISGRNKYRADSFLHQETTKSLLQLLDKYRVPYMTRADWNNR